MKSRGREAFFRLQQSLVEDVLMASDEEIRREAAEAGVDLADSRKWVLDIVEDVERAVKEQDAKKDPAERIANQVATIRDAAWLWAEQYEAAESARAERKAPLSSKEKSR